MAKLVSLGLDSSTPSNRSSLDITRDSFQIGYNPDSKEYGIQFTSTDDGRGTGGQWIPLDRLPDFCDVLESFADPESLTGKQASTDPVEVMRSTMALVTNDSGVADGRVAFRTQLGQGQKPTRMVQAEIPAIVSFLRSKIESSNAVVAQAIAKAKKA